MKLALANSLVLAAVAIAVVHLYTQTARLEEKINVLMKPRLSPLSMSSPGRVTGAAFPSPSFTCQQRESGIVCTENR